MIRGCGSKSFCYNHHHQSPATQLLAVEWFAVESLSGGVGSAGVTLRRSECCGLSERSLGGSG
ncbi:MAG: hypothetical protein PHE53_04625 [Thermoguttaceae bacterium]|nr:hypothetical protein [Thermoguttaceae bacterium]